MGSIKAEAQSELVNSNIHPNSSAQASARHSSLPEVFNSLSPPPTLITQGAEALLYKTYFQDLSNPAALKVRPSKPYRHPILDARLTKQRVLAEARVLIKLAGLEGSDNDVNVPKVFSLDWDVAKKVKGLNEQQKNAVVKRNEKTVVGGSWLMMEWIEGKSVKGLLREWDLWYKEILGDETHRQETDMEEEKVKALLRRIGRAVGVMHSKAGVVHGDLTSSNIMIRPSREAKTNGLVNGNHTNSTSDCDRRNPDLSGDVVLIDFGLAVQSIQDEDRAVDLYVLERAFGSTHPRQEPWFDQEVLQSQDGYKGSYKGATVVLKRLEDVRLRGRKRSMVG